MAERLVAMLTPERSLAERWAQETAQGGQIQEAVLERYLEVTRALVAHLETGEPLRCPDRDEMSVLELRTLRQIGHERVLADGQAEDTPALLTRLDTAIDVLLSDCVDERLRSLEQDALVDPLTGVRNRRALERDLRAALARAQRHHHQVSVAMIDVDGLKAVNDRDGHDAGDGRLRQLASAFVGALREGDGVYRVGGDEFVLVLPYTGPDASRAFLDRVRTTAPQFSAGIATYPDDGALPQALLLVADQRLLEHRGEVRSGVHPAAPASLAGAPVTVMSVSTTLARDVTSVEVVLQQRDREAVGRGSGPPVARAEPRVAGAAALRALEQLGYHRSAHVDSADLRSISDHEVVTVVISSQSGDMEVLSSGSAVVGRSVAEAAARAVVQAIVPAMGEAVIQL